MSWCLRRKLLPLASRPTPCPCWKTSPRLPLYSTAHPWPSKTRLNQTMTLSCDFLLWENRMCLQYLRVTFDPDTGLLSGLSNLKTKQTIKLTQNFYWSVSPQNLRWRICCYFHDLLVVAGTTPAMATTLPVISLRARTSSDPTPPRRSSSARRPRQRAFR